MSSAEESPQDLPNGSSARPTIGALRGTARPRSERSPSAPERSLSPLLDRLGGYVQPEPEDDDWAGEEVPAGAESARGEEAREAKFGKRLKVLDPREVEVSRPEWLWQPWLTRGRFHLVAGRPGTGKTTWVTWVIAQLSAGRPLPGDEGREPVRCGMLSLEEDEAAVKGKLVAAQADLGQVLILGETVESVPGGEELHRPWRFPADLDALETVINDHDLGVVVIDGLGHAFAGRVNDYGEVGSALSSLAALASRTGAAVVGITHVSKGRADAPTAAIGSTAWSALARILWLVGRDDAEEPGRRVVTIAKTNLRPPEHGWSFALREDPEVEMAYVADLQPSRVSADEIASSSSPEERSERAEIRDAVVETLAEREATSRETAVERAELIAAVRRKIGVASDSTIARVLRDAKGSGVASERRDFPAHAFYWLAGPPAPTVVSTSPVTLPDTTGQTHRDLDFREVVSPVVSATPRDTTGTTGTTGGAPIGSEGAVQPDDAADDAPTCRHCRERLLVSESRAAGLCYRCRRAAQVPTADDDWLEPF